MTKKAEQIKEWDREDRFHPRTKKPVQTKDVMKKHRNKVYEFSQTREEDDEYELELYNFN